MAKQIDYPRSSFKNCLELAKAIDDLGGSCNTEMAADKLNKKVSGAFTALVGSAVRFSLITSKSGQLETSDLYRDFKLAYTKTEADLVLAKAFLKPPLFMNIVERFQNRELPVGHFEKLLIREFKVPQVISSRVATYFLDGAKQCGLINENNILNKAPTEEFSGEDELNDEKIQSDRGGDSHTHGELINSSTVFPKIDISGSFSIRITGPGMDSTIQIIETDDLDIVQAMLKKVQKKLSSVNESINDGI